MGDPPDPSGQEVTALFCDEIWERLNAVICGAGGVGAIPAGEGPRLYPNPCDGLFTVAWAGHSFGISITDPAGRILVDEQTGESSLQVNSGLPAGLYFVHLRDEKKTITTIKIVIRQL